MNRPSIAGAIPRLASAWIATVLLSTALPAQRAGSTLQGVVADTAGVPLEGARLTLLELRRSAATDAQGRFRFAALPPGSYSLSVARLGHQAVVRRVTLEEGAEERIEIRLRAAGIQMSAIQVTATPGATLARESPQPIAIIEGAELRVSQGASLGETLEHIPGVRSLSMTTGIGKPVIRGMTHYRVVTLDNGQRSETQAWGHDHSPNVETAAAERVEVIKGPSSVLYGSDALGGVVNVIAPQVPDAIGMPAFARGRFATIYNQNTRGRDGTLSFDAAQGGFGLRGALTMRTSDDMRTPAGLLPNTDNRATATEIAGGYRRGRFALQGRYAGREERIEIFDDPAIAPDYTGFQRIRTDRAILEVAAPVAGARLQATVGYEENFRREFADAFATVPALGLHVANWTGYAHLDHTIGERMGGTFGISGMTSRFTNRGSATLIPNSETANLALYLFEQYDRGRWRLSGGARYDHRTLDADGELGGAARSRAFGAATGSLAALYRLTDEVSLVGSVARGFRAPAAPDLFANGFHEGTRAFERGNPDLRVETSLNSEVGVRVGSANLTAELSAYLNRVEDYIYLRPFGAGIGTFDSLQVVQGDARLAGIEGRIAYRPARWVTLQLSGDQVRGDNLTADVPLTFIPPMRVVYGARVEAPTRLGLNAPYLFVNAETNARQSRIDPRDFAPPGYTLTTLGAGATKVVSRGAVTFDVTAHNLFDVRYRSFMSRYKGFALGMGRSVVVRVTVPL